jgi:hemerythrin
MGSLKWTVSHAVFLPEIDDEHKEIFEALAQLDQSLADGSPLPRIRELTQRLVARSVEHFAHEERLMRAARYESLPWHKQRHDAVRKRARQVVPKIEGGDLEAGRILVEYLRSWLRDHTRLPDRMMAAFLRNQKLCKLTFQAGTKPVEACTWIDSKGGRFDPPAARGGSKF